MASSSSYALTLLSFSLILSLTLICAIPSTTIATAADALSTSGFTAMSLILSLLSQTFTLIPSATLFTTSDVSFLLSLPSGQPPLSLLLLHFSPNLYSSAHLHSLPYGSQLPTFISRKTLSITTASSDEHISINGVNLTSDFPIFNDGILAIYAIDRLFNPNFTAAFSPSPSPYLSPSPSTYLSPSPSLSPGMCSRVGFGSGSYSDISRALRSRGYSAMAAFLTLQLSHFDANITVFVPSDDALKGQFGNFSNWGRVFLRHVVACELSWEDLLGLDDGSVLETFLTGFLINVTRSSDGFLLNGEASIDLPDLYRGDGVVVHGLGRILSEKLGEREF